MQNPKTSPSRILWECFYTNAGCDATPRPVHMIYKNSADCFGLWRRFALLVVPRFRPIAVRLLQRFLLQTPAAQLSWTKPSELPWDQLRRAFSPAAAPSQTPSRGLQRDEGAAPPRPASSTRPPSGPSPPTSPQRGRAGGSFPGEGPWEAGGGLRETGGRAQGSRGEEPRAAGPCEGFPAAGRDMAAPCFLGWDFSTQQVPRPPPSPPRAEITSLQLRWSLGACKDISRLPWMAIKCFPRGCTASRKPIKPHWVRAVLKLAPCTGLVMSCASA